MNRASKIIITLLSIATVIAIIAGVYIHVLGGRGFSFSSKIVEDKVSLDGEPERLLVEIDYADVTLQPGKEFSVAYALPESMVPTVTFQNGALEVKSPKHSTANPFSSAGKYYVTITIPERSEPELVMIKTDAGDQKISDLKCDKLEAEGDSGNIKIDSAEAKEISAKTDAGNIALNGCTADILGAEADAGNLHIDDSTVQRIDASLDAGNIEAKNSTIETGICTTDYGNISLSGNIGDVQTKTSTGKVSVE